MGFADKGHGSWPPAASEAGAIFQHVGPGGKPFRAISGSPRWGRAPFPKRRPPEKAKVSKPGGTGSGRDYGSRFSTWAKALSPSQDCMAPARSRSPTSRSRPSILARSTVLRPSQISVMARRSALT